MERITKGQALYRGMCTALALAHDKRGTQEAVVRACHGIVSGATTVSSWKRGKRSPTDAQVETVCERFGLDIAYFARDGWHFVNRSCIPADPRAVVAAAEGIGAWGKA